MTAPEPTSCPQCHGAGTQTYIQAGKTVWTYCDGCRCYCGAYTPGGLECTPCAIRADVDERRRADV